MPDKLPAQFAWALKPSDLEGAFDGVDPRSAFSISFIGNQALDRRMIDADWSPRTPFRDVPFLASAQHAVAGRYRPLGEYRRREQVPRKRAHAGR